MTEPARTGPAWYRYAAIVLALALVGLPWLLQVWTAPPEATLLREARFGLTVDAANARPVALPHHWRHDCSDCRTAWYHFDIVLDERPREAQAVYLPQVADNAAVYLNGQLLGTGGRFTDPTARLGQRPLWLPAPVALWTVGSNRLYVLVKAERPWLGQMPALALAPERSLRPLAQARAWLAATLPQVVATAAAMLGLVMGVLWFYRRHETDYAVLAAAALAWSAWAYTRLVVEAPWPVPWWDAWGLLSQVALGTTWLVLAWRLAQRPRGHTGAAGVCVALLALAVSALLWPADGAWLGAAQSLLWLPWVVAGAVLARAAWPAGRAGLLACGLVLAGLGGLQAVGAVLPPAWQAPAVPETAALVVLGTAGWLWLLRFVQNLNTLELLNIDLEALVHDRTNELQAQFERVRELERRQAIADERERLMRDMHDGVGGHLVSVLAMIEADRRRPGELASVVRDALDDMRLLVDSLEPVDDDLNAVLAMFRDRLAPRLRVAQVVLHWDIDLLPPVGGLTPARVLHVLRVLQEAVSNALRHGHAKTLWFSAEADTHSVCIVVRDDGHGFDPAAARGGRGLSNMHRRAAELAAQLQLHSAPGQGTTLRLALPLARAGVQAGSVNL